MSRNCFAEAEQVALSIDHILESILSNLNVNDLTQTRLLSHRFNYFSCTKLKLVLGFHLEVCTNTFNNRCSIVGPYSAGVSRGSIEEFTSILSSEYKRFPFPCNNFRLYSKNIVDQRLRNFFSLQGSYIHTFTLHVIEAHPKNVFKELKYLLMQALPNLQSLTLKIEKDKDYFLSLNEFWVDPSNKEQWLLPKLKYLSVVKAPRQMFTLLMNAAINLEKFKAQNDRYLKYFTKPPGNSRLHLLKDLYLSGCGSYSIEKYMIKLELIAGLLATKMEFKIRVLHLKIKLHGLKYVPGLWPRFSSVINNILCSVSKTVEDIFMKTISYEIGINMPVFPKVQMLCIDQISVSYFDNISTVFPNLKFIALFFKNVPWFIYSLNVCLSPTVWKPIVKDYKDFGGIAKFDILSYQVYERIF